MRIGAGWQKEKDGKTFVSLSIDDGIKPLVITKDKSLTLFTNDKKTETKHPDYILCMFEKEEKEESELNKFM